MIKIVNGKRYNTATASLVYAHDNGKNSNDFAYRIKELYRTQSGKWFIYHYGGPSTDMSVPVGGNGRGGSSDIEPVCDDDAFGFLQAHSIDSDAQSAIDEYFSERVEDA